MRYPALLLAAAGLASLAACSSDNAMQNTPRTEVNTAPVGTSNSVSSDSSSNGASGSTIRTQEAQPNVPSQTH